MARFSIDVVDSILFKPNDLSLALLQSQTTGCAPLPPAHPLLSLSTNTGLLRLRSSASLELSTI